MIFEFKFEFLLLSRIHSDLILGFVIFISNEIFHSCWQSIMVKHNLTILAVHKRLSCFDGCTFRLAFACSIGVQRFGVSQSVNQLVSSSCLPRQLQPSSHRTLVGGNVCGGLASEVRFQYANGYKLCADLSSISRNGMIRQYGVV